MADGAVGHVGSDGGQVEDQEVPLAVVLVVEDEGLTALGVRAVADEELTGLDGVGAVAHDHVLGHLADVAAEQEPGVAAGGGEAGEAVLGLLDGRGNGISHIGQIVRIHDPDGISEIGGGLLRGRLGGLLGRLFGGSVGGLLGRSVGGGLDGGIADGGVLGGFATGARYNGKDQSEHENCDNKQLLHGGTSFPLF